MIASACQRLIHRLNDADLSYWTEASSQALLKNGNRQFLATATPELGFAVKKMSVPSGFLTGPALRLETEAFCHIVLRLRRTK
jgi:hypothetical protein